MRELAQALWKINRQMAFIYGKPEDKFAIDVEWKIYGSDRKIILKQVRPFSPPTAGNH